MKPSELPPRLRKVLEAIATGRPPKQLAGELGMAYRTFTTYREDAYRQLDIHSAVEATLAIAGESGERKTHGPTKQ